MENSYRGKELNKFCVLNSSDHLCLALCVNPSSMDGDTINLDWLVCGIFLPSCWSHLSGLTLTYSMYSTSTHLSPQMVVFSALYCGLANASKDCTMDWHVPLKTILWTDTWLLRLYCRLAHDSNNFTVDWHVSLRCIVDWHMTLLTVQCTVDWHMTL